MTTAHRMMVMGDPHSHPDYDNDRFEVAGEFALQQQVDSVVCMGDWFDYASLCKHSTRKSREGSRVVAETQHGQDALRRFMAPFTAHARARKRGLDRVAPACHLILGNHDVRPDLIASDDPSLEGAVATDRYDAHINHGWTLHPFKEVVTLRSIAFCHYMASGVMGRPVGGAQAALLAKNLLIKGHQSTIVGHDHRYGHAKVERWDGTKLHGWSAGCFTHPRYREAWCAQTEPMWDRGLLLLDLHPESDEVLSHAWVSARSLGLTS